MFRNYVIIDLSLIHHIFVMTGLRSLREGKLLTQAELASASGVGIATINRIEQGKVTPSFKTTRAIAKALGIDPVALRRTITTKQGAMF